MGRKRSKRHGFGDKKRELEKKTKKKKGDLELTREMRGHLFETKTSKGVYQD